MGENDDWEYVEVKTGKSKKTKSQKEFKEKKGERYIEKHIKTYDLFD